MFDDRGKSQMSPYTNLNGYPSGTEKQELINEHVRPRVVIPITLALNLDSQLRFVPFPGVAPQLGVLPCDTLHTFNF